MKTLITPPGFTAFHRTVSGLFLAFILGAVAVWFFITDSVSTADLTDKLFFAVVMWMIARYVLVTQADAEAIRQPDGMFPDGDW